MFSRFFLLARHGVSRRYGILTAEDGVNLTGKQKTPLEV